MERGGGDVDERARRLLNAAPRSDGADRIEDRAFVRSAAGSGQNSARESALMNVRGGHGNLMRLVGGLEVDAEELAERLEFGDNESILAWFRQRYPVPIDRK